MKRKKKPKKSIDIELIKDIIIELIQFIGSIASIISIVLYFVERIHK